MALIASYRSRFSVLKCLAVLAAASCATAPDETSRDVQDALSATESTADASTALGTPTIAIKAARPAPMEGDDDGNVAAEAEERWRIKQQQLQMEAEETFLDGQRLFQAGRYDDAVVRFEQVMGHIRYAETGIDWGDLQERTADALKSAERARAREESELEVEQSKAAYDRLVTEEKTERQRELQLTQSLLKDGLAAFMRNDFRDAENLANRVIERDPKNLRAGRLLEDSQAASRRQYNESVIEDRKGEYRDWLLDIDETKIPYFDIVQGPSAEYWRDISEKRTQHSLLALEATFSPADKELQQRVRTTHVASIAFPGVALGEAISILGAVSGIPMVVDSGVKAELDSAGVDLNVPELTDLSVDSILNIILDQASSEELKLVQRPQHGVIVITSQAKARGASVPRVHSMQDLTFPINDFKGPKIGYISLPTDETDEENPLFGGELVNTQVVQPEEIQTLVRSNIKGDWDDGGHSIDITGDKQLLVINTPEVQLQVAQFLDDLRRFQSEVVTVESRFINIDRAFLQEIGVDFRGLGGSSGGTEAPLNDITSGLEDNAGLALDNNGPGLLTGEGVSPIAGAFFNDGSDGDVRAFTQNFFAEVATNGDPALSALGKALSNVGGASLQYALFSGDSEYNAVVRAVEKSLNATEVEAPVITVYNRERSYVTVVNQITFVQDFDVDVANSAFIANPNIGVIQEGVVLDVQPTISFDRKTVTLEVRTTVAELLRPIREFTTSLSGFTIPVTFQLPELEVQQAETTVRVPDGGSLVIGGLKRLRYVNRTAEVPWLGRIPLVGVLFRQKGFDDETASLIVLMKVNITSMDPWR